MTLQELQKEIFENKKRHGFNTTDMNEEFCHLVAEVGEAYDAWFRGKDTFAEELADVAIFLLGIAEMKGIDLQKEIEKKEKINESRECVTNELGHRVHKTLFLHNYFLIIIYRKIVLTLFLLRHKIF